MGCSSLRLALENSRCTSPLCLDHHQRSPHSWRMACESRRKDLHLYKMLTKPHSPASQSTCIPVTTDTLQPVRSQETLETIRGFETANCEGNIHALEVREAPAEPEPAPLYQESDSWGALKLSTKERKRRRERECAIATRHNRSSSKLPGLVLDVSVVPPFPTSSLIGRHYNTDQTDYTAVFFCHVKLYVLAEKYGVERLKKLSSDCLSKSFIHYEHATKPSVDIPGLLRYVFNHTPERRGGDIEGQTRERLTDSRADILQDICVPFCCK